MSNKEIFNIDAMNYTNSLIDVENLDEKYKDKVDIIEAKGYKVIQLNTENINAVAKCLECNFIQRIEAPNYNCPSCKAKEIEKKEIIENYLKTLENNGYTEIKEVNENIYKAKCAKCSEVVELNLNSTHCTNCEKEMVHTKTSENGYKLIKYSSLEMPITVEHIKCGTEFMFIAPFCICPKCNNINNLTSINGEFCIDEFLIFNMNQTVHIEHLECGEKQVSVLNNLRCTTCKNKHKEELLKDKLTSKKFKIIEFLDGENKVKVFHEICENEFIIEKNKYNCPICVNEKLFNKRINDIKLKGFKDIHLISPAVASATCSYCGTRVENLRKPYDCKGCKMKADLNKINKFLKEHEFTLLENTNIESNVIEAYHDICGEKVQLKTKSLLDIVSNDTEDVKAYNNAVDRALKCPTCKKINEEKLKILGFEDIVIIDSQHINATHKECGIKYENLKAPYKCGVCISRNARKNRAKEKGFELIDETNLNDKTFKLKHTKCGNVVDITPPSYKCPICAGYQRIESRGFKDVVIIDDKHIDAVCTKCGMSHKMLEAPYKCPNCIVIKNKNKRIENIESKGFKDVLIISSDAIKATCIHCDTVCNELKKPYVCPGCQAIITEQFRIKNIENKGFKDIELIDDAHIKGTCTKCDTHFESLIKPYKCTKCQEIEKEKKRIENIAKKGFKDIELIDDVHIKGTCTKCDTHFESLIKPYKCTKCQEIEKEKKRIENIAKKGFKDIELIDDVYIKGTCTECGTHFESLKKPYNCGACKKKTKDSK